MNRGKEIMLVVGEASGDLHGASLVKALLKRDPNLTFFGVAGDQLQRMPFEAVFTVAKLTGMPTVAPRPAYASAEPSHSH
jgi:lipid A disaccharide synthetase